MEEYRGREKLRYPDIAVKFILCWALVCLGFVPVNHDLAVLTMTADSENSGSEVKAAQVAREIKPDAENPAKEWESASPVHFDTDWQGQNADPGLDTEVRVLWSPTKIYLRFVCHYRELFTYEDSDPSGRRDYLWDRDVTEAFLQPPDSLKKSSVEAAASEHPENSLKFYNEFEIAPNGMWIDLDILPLGRSDLRSGLTRSVHLDEKRKIWAAELAIPIKAITANFDPSVPWRVNFFRVEGKIEPRRYMAWQPTMTPEPNFHVPEKFGTLRFH